MAATRRGLTFVNTTAIAYCLYSGRRAKIWRYEIAVVFTNVNPRRVYESEKGEKEPGLLLEGDAAEMH